MLCVVLMFLCDPFLYSDLVPPCSYLYFLLLPFNCSVLQPAAVLPGGLPVHGEGWAAGMSVFYSVRVNNWILYSFELYFHL